MFQETYIKKFKVIERIDQFSGGLGLLGAWLLVPLIIATCYEVVARYGFGAPTIWAYEIGYSLTGAHFLLGIAFALRNKKHIRVDVFSMHFKETTRAKVDLAAYCALLPLLIWLSWMLGEHFWKAWLSSEGSGQSAFNAPVWPMRLVVLLAFVMFALQVWAELLRRWMYLRHPDVELNAGKAAQG